MSVAINDIHTASLRIAAHRPRRNLARRFLKRSSVAIVLDQRKGLGPSILMIRRAEREGDPWSGHMGFPGGRAEMDDAHSVATAKRETIEEIGLDCDCHTELVGRLSDLSANAWLFRRPLVVTPWVFRLRSEPELTLNEEVDDTVWVPLSFLSQRANRDSMQVHWRGLSRDFDCYHYGQYTIWGLSLRMIDELLAVLGHRPS